MNTLPGNIILASQKAYTKYGLLPSIQLAQYILESAWGLKLSGKNNPFGIKAVKTQAGSPKITHEVDASGHEYKVIAKFRDFDSIEQAFDLHANLLVNGKPYITCRPYLKDYHMYCIMMGRIYATDPQYGQKLISLIDQHKLTQYDKYYIENKPVVAVIAATAGSSVALAAINAPKVIHHFDYMPMVYIGIGFVIGILTMILWAIIEHFKQKDGPMAIRPEAQPIIDAVTALAAKAAQGGVPQAQLDEANATIAQLQANLNQKAQDDADTDAALKAAAEIA